MTPLQVCMFETSLKSGAVLMGGGGEGSAPGLRSLRVSESLFNVEK